MFISTIASNCFPCKQSNTGRPELVTIVNYVETGHKHSNNELLCGWEEAGGFKKNKKAVGRGAKLQFVHEQTHLKGQPTI